MKIRVGIIGCGAIFVRHIEAIEKNSNAFELVAVCDIDSDRLNNASIKYKVPGFEKYSQMLSSMKDKMDMVVIATPNLLHYEQAMDSLKTGYDVLIEKPVAFESSRVLEIAKMAEEVKKNAYVVLQVRYNPTIGIIKESLDNNLLGEIRSVSLIQRWQRPAEYFKSWRADEKVGGRILYEVGIHYLDILQYLFGLPSVIATSTFKHKHKNISFEDTVFSIFNIKDISGGLEVTVAAEPSNLECSISVLGSEGFIKLGGRALDEIETAKFTQDVNLEKLEKIKKKYGKSLEPNSYGTHLGSSPNHPDLYREIAKGNGIPITEAINSIKFIQEIYKKEIK